MNNFSNKKTSVRVRSLALVLTCGTALACDPTAEVSTNIELGDEEVRMRAAGIDCAQWLEERQIQQLPGGDIDIGYDFASLAFDDGFVAARACEETTTYDLDPSGDWVVHGADPGDLTWALGIRDGDRNVMVRGLDSVTGMPTGPWVPMAFPFIPPMSLLHLSQHVDFQVRALNDEGIRTYVVHLTD